MSLDRIDGELMDDVRAFRASRPKATCRCGWGPDPDCPVDHQGIREEMRIAADRKVASAQWLGESIYELDELRDPLLLSFLIAEDYAEFGRRVRVAFQRLADEHVKYEYERKEVTL